MSSEALAANRQPATTLVFYERTRKISWLVLALETLFHEVVGELQ